MLDLVFVTGNQHKLSEVRAILGGSVIVQAVALDVPEIQGTLEQITQAKCRLAAEKVVTIPRKQLLESSYKLQLTLRCQINGPVLVEDSALEMRALNGLPGPYIKAFVDAIGNEGLCKLLDPYDNKAAEAVCTFGYTPGPGSEPVLFQGRLLGRIVPARGLSSFGWEPIFEFDGETLAEMSAVKKNGLSHRFKALCEFKKWIKQTSA